MHVFFFNGHNFIIRSLLSVFFFIFLIIDDCVQVLSLIIINTNVGLDFLYARLNQIQMCLFEAVKSTPCPCTSVGFLWIFVGTFHNLWLDFRFIFALAQLLDQVINVEAIFFIEKAHFAENAFDVALRLFVVREIKFLVFVNCGFGNLQR